MGIFQKIAKSITAPSTMLPYASPWSEREFLEPIFPNVFLPEMDDVISTREQAMKIPSLARSRGLICSTIARLPLVAVDENGNDNGLTPEFITKTSGVVSPFQRMLWTVDDLFFHGYSLWLKKLDKGKLVDALRIPFNDWWIDDDNYIHIENVIVSAKDVIIIPGMSEGILATATETLTQAQKLERAAARAADNPSAQIELHDTGDAILPDEEIDSLTARWAQARAGANGGVAYTGPTIEVKEHGASSEHLLIEGRNAVAIDVARHAGIPATMIDATLSGSSLSYQNSAIRMSELITFGLWPHMAAIASRLSQDDVTPAGIKLAFDLDDTFADLNSLTALTSSPAATSQESNPNDSA